MKICLSCLGALRSAAENVRPALYGVGLAALLPAAAFAASVGDRLERIQGPFETRVYATGLKSPDGLAIHPKSEELYVSDEDSSQVYVVRNGSLVPALKEGWTIPVEVPDWAITAERSKAHWMNPRLRSPEGICFSADGHLFVTEDIAKGRLLEFIPNAAGEYDTCRPIPMPWMDKPYEWESVTVASDGRLFVAGAVTSTTPGLLFGVILMRDPAGVWWAVDYAPFASFSALALSRKEEILVTGEEFPGAVTWWDTDRRQDVGDLFESIPNVEGVAVLPDGGILIVQESQIKNAGSKIPGFTEPGTGGRLLLVDPETRAIEVLADGFGTIESVVVAPDSGYLYVSEDSSGLVLELRPTRALAGVEYKLNRSLQEFEILHGYAPKRWPDFLRSFMDKIGVETSDRQVEGKESSAADMAKEGLQESYGAGLTLQEFADRVPLVAGKIKAELLPGHVDHDPVQEIDFVSFFPNHMVTANSRTMPSVSLMSVKRQSGQVERTRMINSFKVSKRLATGEYAAVGEGADLYVPLTTCSAVQFGNTLNLLLSHVGLGPEPDYHIQLACGAVPKGRLMVERGRGESASYNLNCIDYTTEGHRVMNFVVAGINPRREEGVEWLELGDRPNLRLVGLSDPTQGGWISRWIARRNPQLHEMLAKGNADDGRAFDRYLENLKPPTELAQPANLLPGTVPAETDQRAEQPSAPRLSQEQPLSKDPQLSEEAPGPQAPRLSEDATPGAPRLSEQAPPSAPRLSEDARPDAPRLSEEKPEDAPRFSEEPGPRDPVLSEGKAEATVSESDEEPAWDELLLTRAVRAFEAGSF